MVELEVRSRVRSELLVGNIGLPEMDGYQLAHELRERPHDPHLRVVAITGYSRNPDREREECAAFDAYLIKPVRAEKLSAVLHEVCGLECA